MTKFVRAIFREVTCNAIVFATIVFAVLACNARSVAAQSRPLPYWQHSEWVGDRGPPVAGEYDLERSGDGYLWLGALNALIRFDGIRFTVFDSSNAPALRVTGPGPYVPLFLDKRGLMWIRGPAGSLLTYADGVVRIVFGRGAETVGGVTEDRAGRIWLWTDSGIRLIEHGRLIVPNLPDVVRNASIYGLQPDTADGLWIGTMSDGLYHVQGNRTEHFGSGRIRAMRQSRDGVVWVIGERPGLDAGLWQLVSGRFVEVHVPGEPSRHIQTRLSSEGADGSVWFTTPNAGLLRWHNGALQKFTKEDGLSNNRIRDVFADADGAVWASTDAGLDRLRPSMFASVEKRNGLPLDQVGRFVEDSSGAIWLAAEQWAYLLDGGIIRNRPGSITYRHLPRTGDSYFQLIASSRFGGAWFGPRSGGILKLNSEGAEVARANKDFPKLRIGVAIERRDGALLVKALEGELGWFKDGKYKASPLFEVGKQSNHNWTEDELGRLWLVSRQERVTVLSGDSIVRQFELPQSSENVTGLAAEHADTVWALTQSKLIRIIGQHSVEVVPKGLDRLLAAGARAVISGGFLWVGSSGGFARMPLHALHRAADTGMSLSSVEVFNPLDGIAIARGPTEVSQSISVGHDGRVWVTTPNGFAVADPTFRESIMLPRKIHIEEFSAGDRSFPVRDGAKVQPLPTNVSFRFTVPTLLLAERVRMQYRLEGADDRWIDATVPRIATYNGLRPGHFVFRVRAWDETGKQIPGEATLAFRVLPTWYQSWWFTVLVIATAGGALFMLYQLRMRQLAHAYNVRLEERWAERTRIARELHDTLLQGFQGLMFHLQAARDMLPAQTNKAMPALDAALQKGEAVIDQARSAVGDLRSSENVPTDFDAGLAAIAAEAVHECKNGDSPAWTIDTKGRITEIPPTVLYELYQVAKEAICNAFRHAHATHVSIEVRYSFNTFRLAITDDGIGFDEASFSTTQRETHFGLRGMRERIARLGGEVTVNSRAREGTRVTLSIPATVAYHRGSSVSAIGAFFRRSKRSKAAHGD